MQAVILAAGRGTRLHPLTSDRPKPMVEVSGKPILAHVIDALPEAVDEVVLIVGHAQEVIHAYFGNSYDGRTVSYVVQDMPRGTADALFAARSALRNERFLIVPGDNISWLPHIDEGVPHSYALFAIEHSHPERFGVIELNADGATLKQIREKPEVPPTNLISTGAMILSPDMFEYELIYNEDFGEYLLPDMLMQVRKYEPIHVLEQDLWIPIDRPEDVPAAEDALG